MACEADNDSSSMNLRWIQTMLSYLGTWKSIRMLFDGLTKALEVEVVHLKILLEEAAVISMTTNLQEARKLVSVRGV